VSVDAPAIIRYQMAYGNWLLDDRRKADGVQAWHIVRKMLDVDTKVTLSFEAIAIFNLDSEGHNFQRYLEKTGGNLAIDPELAELFELQRRTARLR
jgi:hypothetical protein